LEQYLKDFGDVSAKMSTCPSDEQIIFGGSLGRGFGRGAETENNSINMGRPSEVNTLSAKSRRRRLENSSCESNDKDPTPFY